MQGENSEKITSFSSLHLLLDKHSRKRLYSDVTGKKQPQPANKGSFLYIGQLASRTNCVSISRTCPGELGGHTFRFTLCLLTVTERL